jgi:hypothetical protein
LIFSPLSEFLSCFHSPSSSADCDASSIMLLLLLRCPRHPT